MYLCTHALGLFNQICVDQILKLCSSNSVFNMTAVNGRGPSHKRKTPPPTMPRPQNQQEVSHDGWLELRGLHLVLVWLASALLKWSRDRASFKTSVSYFICHQTEALKPQMGEFKGHGVPRCGCLLLRWNSRIKYLSCFLLPDKAVPQKDQRLKEQTPERKEVKNKGGHLL